MVYHAEEAGINKTKIEDRTEEHLVKAVLSNSNLEFKEIDKNPPSELGIKHYLRPKAEEYLKFDFYEIIRVIDELDKEYDLNEATN